jgi:hypothetical protein
MRSCMTECWISTATEQHLRHTNVPRCSDQPPTRKLEAIGPINEFLSVVRHQARGLEVSQL